MTKLLVWHIWCQPIGPEMQEINLTFLPAKIKYGYTVAGADRCSADAALRGMVGSVAGTCPPPRRPSRSFGHRNKSEV
jgi:hypothetical protein